MNYRIEKLEIIDFLGKENIAIEFDKNMNILIGPNGCGKTTILEMIANLGKRNYIYFKDIPFSKFILELEGNKLLTIEKEKNMMIFKKKIGVKRATTLSTLDLKTIGSRYIDEISFNSEHYVSKKIDINYEILAKFMERHKEGKRNNIPKIIKSSEINVDFIPLTRAYHFHNETDYQYLNLESLFKDLKNKYVQAMTLYAKENESFKEKILTLPFRKETKMGSFINTLYETIKFTDEESERIISTYGELVNKKELKNIVEQLDKIKKIKNIMKNKQEDLLNKTKEELLDKFLKGDVNQEILDSIESLPRIEIIKLIGILASELLEKKEEIFEKFRRIENVLNIFFEGTGKSLRIHNDGTLKINLGKKMLDTNYLSSGEKQLVTLFTYIMLKTSEEGNKIFMIDEPEISLHLRWQEKFIEALNKIGNNQYILATHSPEIIGRYINKVKVLNDGGVFKK